MPTLERGGEGFDSGSVPASARQGQILGGTYRLLERIGAGGMAEVYAAEHVRLGRQFAVKVLRRDEGPKALSRFRREARAVARIRNEFVVEVVDSGEADGAPYLVMELLVGEDLRSLLTALHTLPIPRAVNLIREACHGVAAVHQAGLVHRDLKPENLFVSKRSTGEDWCKILDFGIAKTELSGSTMEGAVLGTIRYMAPEQLQDGASAGPSADIYALGAILYELLSGACLHSAVTVQELMFKVLNVEPVRLERLRPEIPVALADAVHRALAIPVEHRFSDVHELAQAIAPFSSIRAGAGANPFDQTLELEDNVARPALVVRSRRAPLLLAMLLSAIGGFCARGLVSKARTSVAASATVPVSPAVTTGTAQREPRATPSIAPVAVVPTTTPAPSANVAPGRSTPTATTVVIHTKAPTQRVPVGAHAATFDNENPYPR